MGTSWLSTAYKAWSFYRLSVSVFTYLKQCTAFGVETILSSRPLTILANQLEKGIRSLLTLPSFNHCNVLFLWKLCRSENSSFQKMEPSAANGEPLLAVPDQRVFGCWRWLRDLTPRAVSPTEIGKHDLDKGVCIVRIAVPRACYQSHKQCNFVEVRIGRG